jgi:GTPase SAR1 family protein
MSSAQNEIRIGLIGPSSAGKTSMFHTFHEALDRGRHGFAKAMDPQIRSTAEATPIEGLSPEDVLDAIVVGESNEGDAEAGKVLAGDIDSTRSDQAPVSRHFSLSYGDRQRERQTIQLTITDAAGEHSFGKNVQNSALKEYRRQLNQELGKCQGFVVVVPFSNATDASFVRQLESWLNALDKIAAAQEKGGALPTQRRLVIALTRYDTLLTDFGSEALNLAADPAIATDIINRLLQGTRNGVGYKNNIAKYDRSNDGRFRIAFVPTSSFGFVPGFGCVNLDPYIKKDDATRLISGGTSPDPFKKVSIPAYPGQHLFPFLTADPFIFAATGLDNPFVVPIDLALDQVSYADRQAALDRKRAGPNPQPRGRTSAGNGKQPNVPPETMAADKGSWRQRLAIALKRLDIDLEL